MLPSGSEVQIVVFTLEENLGPGCGQLKLEMIWRLTSAFEPSPMRAFTDCSLPLALPHGIPSPDYR